MFLCSSIVTKYVDDFSSFAAVRNVWLVHRLDGFHHHRLRSLLRRLRVVVVAVEEVVDSAATEHDRRLVVLLHAKTALVHLSAAAEAAKRVRGATEWVLVLLVG